MMHRLSIVRIAAVATFLAGGSALVVAQDRPGRTVPPVAKSGTVMMSTPNGPVATGALHSPGNRVMMAMTEAECTGLGGSVVTLPDKSCASGKACFTAGPDNVIHQTCIKAAQ